MIEELSGKEKLRKAVDKDLKESHGFHDYEAKFQWIIKRANHYAEKTGLAADDILNSWESDRNYWYMNYYQECNQPLIKSDDVRVFENLNDLKNSIGDKGFRCPKCKGISSSPYRCDTKIKVAEKQCDWKSYGLFGTMGQGVTVFVKDKIRIETFFMPLAWEND